MAIKDKLTRKAAPFLASGESVQQALRARVLVPSTHLAKATYVVIGTEASVLILRTSIWSTSTPVKVVARVPRTEPITLHRTGWWSRLQIGDHEVRIAGRASLTEAALLVNTEPDGRAA